MFPRVRFGTLGHAKQNSTRQAESLRVMNPKDRQKSPSLFHQHPLAALHSPQELSSCSALHRPILLLTAFKDFLPSSQSPGHGEALAMLLRRMQHFPSLIHNPSTLAKHGDFSAFKLVAGIDPRWKSPLRAPEVPLSLSLSSTAMGQNTLTNELINHIIDYLLDDLPSLLSSQSSGLGER
ncbi:hypothetical protein C8J56DRAFT_1049513 [Mycena floridula]|nr:hypothetical protein C8J56DRAFT_1049513 [Mycena floridula]